MLVFEGATYTLSHLQGGERPQYVYSLPKISARKLMIRGACLYCGEETKHLTRDHMLPKSAGYALLRNCAKVCARCNTHKGARTTGQWIADPSKTSHADVLRILGAVGSVTMHPDVLADLCAGVLTRPLPCEAECKPWLADIGLPF